MRILHGALLLVPLICAGCTPLRGLLPTGGSPVDRLAAGVTIVRDTWGVPHILADTDEAAMFGLGYVQAEDDFRQIEEDYLHALGRASHWYGEEVLASDLVRRSFEVERLGREEYEREPADRRALWDAFAAGINYFVRTSGARPRLITTVEPWMPFALARARLLDGTFDGVRLGERTEADGMQMVGVFDSTGRAARDAALAIAMAPSRTANGRPVLIHSAHSSFTGPGRPYEFMVLSEEGWHVRGAAQLGTPAIHSGHNEHLAWARIDGDADVADVYELVFDDPADAAMYRFDGGWRAAQDRVDTLLVNSPSGVVPRTFRFRSTVHGPVVAAAGDRSLALRIVGMAEGGAIQQSYAFSRAAGTDAFRAALDGSVTGGAIVYADRTGTIMHVPAAAEPIRAATVDWTRPVDGSTSATMWRGFHSVADLPQIINPEQGWVVSGAAAALSVDSARSFAQLAALPFDMRLPNIEEEIAALASEWEQVGGRDAARARGLDGVVDRLRSWDAVAGPESEAATLYLLWQEQLRTVPYAGDLVRFRAMEAVLAGLERHHGSTSVQWGAVNRLRRMDVAEAEEFSDKPAALPGLGGAPSWAGSAFVVDVTEEPVGAPRYAVAGTSWIHAVELGPLVLSQSVVPFGQSGDSTSAHYLDQAPLFLRSDLKPAYFSRDDVLANGVRRYHPAAAVRELP